MTRNGKIGMAIVLGTAIGAATGLIVGILHVQPAVGAAVIGIILGTAVARGWLSGSSKGAKCD